MTKANVLQKLKRERALAIIRMRDGENVAEMVDRLVKAGIRALEITSNTPNFEKEISAARKKYPGILIGAGTIVNAKLAHSAVKSGAQFLVTPNVGQEVIQVANNAQVPILVGAMTPTEIFTAIDFGADAIKLFPAQILGIDFFKAIRAVVDAIDFFAVGGIDLNNANEWIKAGVSGVGLGSSLTSYITNVQNESAEGEIERFLQKLKEG